LFKNYLTALLNDVTQAGTVCSGSCGSGLSAFFKVQPPKTPTVKRERIVKRKRKVKSGKKKRPRFGSRKSRLLAGSLPGTSLFKL